MTNIYLIYGIDNSLINIQLKHLITSNQINENNIIKYSLEEIDNILEEVSTISLFSDKKLLIIEMDNSIDFKDNLTLLENYLLNKQDDNIIIFVYNQEKIDSRRKIIKIINEKGKILELKKDYSYLINYISNYLKDNNFAMSKLDIDYFLSLVGSNINNITNELDKLMSYRINDKKITKEDIKSLVEVNLEEGIFALTDAVINNNVDKSLELYNDFLNKNYDELAIIALLASQFRFLFQVKRLSNQDKSSIEIANLLEAHPYRVKLAIEKNYYYQEKDYLKYLKVLADYDRDIKLGKIDKNLFELFLINKDM